jgi:DNA polymerase-1
VLGIPIEQVTPDQRRLAKMVNFGVLYGMSDYGLAERTGLAREEAARFIARYFERFATVKAFQERIIREAERTGYASSLLGRRRYVPEIRSPVYGIRERARRELINQPIQSTAADIIKIAMVRVHDYLREHGLKTRMILQVHDELLFEAPEEEVRPFAPVLCDLMANALKLDVPLVVDLKVGPNWEDLRPLTL